MSRAGVIAVVLGLVVLGVGATFALGLLGSEDDAPDATDTPVAAGITLPPVSSTAPTTSTPAPATTQGEDPLCAAHAIWQEALDGHLPVEGSEDLEAVHTATLAFYTEAVGHVTPPEQDAFAEFVVYEQASYDYSEANEWNPSPPLEELLENPPPTPPQGATAVVIHVLEERCGLEVTFE